jgi:hypothetical protein
MMRIPFIAVFLLVAPLSLGAQGQEDPAQRIEAARRRADASGIPVSLLDMKVAEGRAKGVPADRIAGAVEIRLSLLARAREAMAVAGRGPLSAADLSAGADALSAGVSTEALGSLARSAPGDRRAVAIAVLAQLVQEGDRSDRALERVRLALANPETLRTLPGQVRRGNNGVGNADGVRGERPGNAESGLASTPPNGVGGAAKPVNGDEGRKRARRP